MKKLRVRFNQTQDFYSHRFFKGGLKEGGDFEPHQGKNYAIHNGEHPGSGHVIQWECLDLYLWINCGSGRNWNEAAAIAKRILTKKLLRIPATIEIMEA